MTAPSSSLKKPIIFNPTPAIGSGAPEDDEPLTGEVPSTLKKSAISENIFGGAVEFEKSRTPQGCPCRKQLPEKYRYDAQFKRGTPVVATPCGCNATAVAKPEDALPPVIAKLYPIRANTTNTTAPCPAPPAPIVQKIAPAYYPKRVKVAAPVPCAKNATAPVVPATVTPSFYPTRSERRARRAARKAAKAAKKN